MESLINIPEAVIGQRCHSRKKRVRFCEEFMNCADACCTNEAQTLERQAEGDSSSKSETPLLTAPSDEPQGWCGFHVFPKELK